MSFDWSFKDYFNLSRKIPLHYQKRYLANISNGSFNASILTGMYKNKIKKLLENNKVLALAIQNDRAQKEELLVESKANADLVLFSRLKLATMSVNLKKAVSVLDEALSLLEMHSSNSVSKFTPKNTISQEEFKEQLKGVTMTAIPEEVEFPECIQTPTKRSLTKDSIHNSSSSNKKKINMEPKNCESKSINENLSQVKIHDEIATPVKKSDSQFEIINDRISLLKRRHKKRIYSRKGLKKTTSQSSNQSKKENSNADLSEATETLQLSLFTQTKIDSSSNSEKIHCSDNSTEKTILNKCDALSPNPDQKHLCAGIPQEKNSKGKKSSKSFKSNNKKASEVHSTLDCLSVEESSSHESLRNNSHDKSLLSTTKEGLINKDFKKSNVKKTALKNISSQVNIENMKHKYVCTLDTLTINEEDKKEIRKRKSVYPLNDLTVINKKDVFKKKKSDTLVLKNIKKSVTRKKMLNENISPALDTSNLPSDLILQSDAALHAKEEMVKNLVQSTLLVSAEALEMPTAVTEIRPKTDTLQPVVLINDVFKASRSLSSQPFNQANKISLEKQLLQHCSSLKIISEDSPKNKSSVNSDSGGERSLDKDENSPNTVLNIEPPLLIDGKVIEKQIKEDKKCFRKRQLICYKEPPTNIKLRR